MRKRVENKDYKYVGVKHLSSEEELVLAARARKITKKKKVTPNTIGDLYLSNSSDKNISNIKPEKNENTETSKNLNIPQNEVSEPISFKKAIT